MNTLFKKLNYKAQPVVYVLNAPESFETDLESLTEQATLLRSLDQSQTAGIEFIMAFVTGQNQINEIIPLIAPRLEGDAILWMCYPKKTSKNYQCDFNRDTGWAILGEYGLEGVRMVAIDTDWSALRFRKVAYIKQLTRKFNALSEEGKIKSGQMLIV